MYIYTHTYTHIHTHTHANIYTHKHTHKHTHHVQTHTYTHKHIHTNECTQTHTHTHAIYTTQVMFSRYNFNKWSYINNMYILILYSFVLTFYKLLIFDQHFGCTIQYTPMYLSSITYDVYSRSLPGRLLTLSSQTLCRHVIPLLLTPLAMGEPAARKHLWKHIFTPVTGNVICLCLLLYDQHYCIV